jgi:hypothetical protein
MMERWKVVEYLGEISRAQLSRAAGRFDVLRKTYRRLGHASLGIYILSRGTVGSRSEGRNAVSRSIPSIGSLSRYVRSTSMEKSSRWRRISISSADTVGTLLKGQLS